MIAPALGVALDDLESLLKVRRFGVFVTQDAEPPTMALSGVASRG